MNEVCTCTGRSTGFHQHPEFLEIDGEHYAFEFFVCGECNKPTRTYLEKMMETVE